MVKITAGYLASSLEEAATSFAAGELAYLALTSKVELPLRDRLAWSLSTMLPDLVVAREWKRVDLALLDRTAKAIALVESKALYTFDVAMPGLATVRKYRGWVEDDMAKSFALLDGHPASVFALILVTHPMDVPPELDGVIKYRPSIQAALNRASQEEIRAGARSTLSSVLPPGPAVHGSLMAGTAFGVRVIVDYSIVGPVATPGG